MKTAINLAFADGEYTFRLGLSQINEIQSRCGTGIGAVYARVLKGRYLQSTPQGDLAIGDPSQGEYRLEDLLTVIRQGLLGGARGSVDGAEVRVDTTRATEIMTDYVYPADGCPLKDAWGLAAAILSVAIEGYSPPGEAGPPEAAAREAEAVTVS